MLSLYIFFSIWGDMMPRMKARYTSAWSVRTPPSLTRGNTLTTWKSATQLGSSKLSKRGQATTKTNSNTSFTFLGYGHNSLDCSFICNSGKPGFFVRFEEKLISPTNPKLDFCPLKLDCLAVLRKLNISKFDVKICINEIFRFGENLLVLPKI